MHADAEPRAPRPTGRVVVVLGTVICLLTLIEVNYPHLAPPAQLALFALLGLVLCFVTVPAHKSLQGKTWARTLDLGLAGLTVVCFGYVFTQNEPLLDNLWIVGSPDDVAAQLRQLHQKVGGFGVLLAMGHEWTPKDQWLNSMTLLINDVMPKLADLD